MVASVRLVTAVAVVAMLSACGSRVIPAPSASRSASQTIANVSTPTATASATATPNPTPTPKPTVRITTPPLARTLAGARLGMSQPELRAALGEPQTTGPAPGSGLLQWTYANGVSVEFGEGPPITTSLVYAVDIQAPFQGSTSVGVRIGDSRDAFREAYAAYPLHEIENNTSLIDDDGITVLGSFDARDRLINLGLFQGGPPRR
jgi:hypothetical protein